MKYYFASYLNILPHKRLSEVIPIARLVTCIPNIGTPSPAEPKASVISGHPVADKINSIITTS